MPNFIKPELPPRTTISNKLQDQDQEPPSLKLSTEKQSPKELGRSFFMAFFTVFLAELGDKTQLATLMMAAESQSPWIVFTGAASALVLVSLVGVILGRWLASRLTPDVLRTAAGASLLLIAVLLLWDITHL